MTDTISTPARAAEAIPEGPGRSFWQVVRRSFFRYPLHRIATAYVAVLALIAVFVPFIANGRPFWAQVLNPATGQWEQRYPLFKSLTRVDLIVLVVAAAFLLYGVVHFLTRAQADPASRARRRRRAFFVILGAAALGSFAIGIFKHDFNDLLHREDYRQLSSDYDVRHAVFPPLPWGFDDAAYPLKPESRFQDPSAAHWLGTDGTGRDTLSRLLWSTRIVFGIGVVSQFVAFLIGVIYGALMGYFGGTVDILGNRFMEIVESVPTYFLIITCVALFGRQISIIMLILALVGWTGIARFVRADFLRLRNADFVQAAVSCGLPLRSVLFRHILPNALTPILVNLTFGIAGAVTIESSLSFLGLGVEPPTASWGSMLQEAGNPASIFHFFLALAPGFMIFLTIFAYNIIGEGLRDAIDPKTNKIQ
jgi:peptide/nickel transport system permease protein